MRVAETTKKGVEKDNLTEEANKDFLSIVDARTIEGVPEQEMGSRDGSSHYVPCINRGLQLFRDINVMAAEQIQRDDFADNVNIRGTRKEVSRINKAEDNGQKCNGTVPKIVATGGPKLMAITVSGEDDERAL